MDGTTLCLLTAYKRRSKGRKTNLYVRVGEKYVCACIINFLSLRNYYMTYNMCVFPFQKQPLFTSVKSFFL